MHGQLNLSPDYNERTTIAAWRMFIGMVANVATKVLPVVALIAFFIRRNQRGSGNDWVGVIIS